MIGRAVVHMLKKDNIKIVIGHDHRQSGSLLSNSLACGVTSEGADVIDIGDASVGSISFAIKDLKADAAILITASDNNDDYYGFKFYNGNGFVIAKEQQDFIEYFILNSNDYEKKSNKIGKITKKNNIINKYIDYLIKNSQPIINIKEICVDCDNNNSKIFLTKLFDKLDIKYKLINVHNNKLDLIKQLNFSNYNFGIKLNSDLSSILFYDKNGEIKSEEIAYFFAKNIGNIIDNDFTNIKLDEELEKDNIKHIKLNQTGELTMTENLLINDYDFGFENTGKYYFFNQCTTCDAVYALLKFLQSLAVSSFSRLHLYYTKLIKVDCEKAMPIVTSKEYLNSKNLCESLLLDVGRIIDYKNIDDDSYNILIESSDEVICEKIYKELNSFFI